MKLSPLKLFDHFRAHQKGATAIEYGLIAALVCIAAIAGMRSLGGSNNKGWGGVATAVTKATKAVSKAQKTP